MAKNKISPEQLHKAVTELPHDDKERMIEVIEGMTKGKSLWEMMTVDELPLYLASHPREIFEWNCMFIGEFLKVLFFRLRQYINQRIENRRRN